MLKTINQCRSCHSNNLLQILDLGKQHLSDFRADDTLPPAYPLELVICMNCTLVQLRHTTPSAEMYHENYGFKSGVSDSIRADLKEVVEQALEVRPDTESWLDIASNDGTLLSYVPKNIYRVGVDPISKLCQEASQHANKIVNNFFNSKDMTETFDVITSISMFYDLDDPNQFVSDVEWCLADRGVWVIQQNYLLTTLQLNAIDNICHEHIEYYTLQSLEHLLNRHGLEVFKLNTSMVNGGSIRTFVARKGDYHVEQSVLDQRAMEADFGIGTMAPYRNFAGSVRNSISDLRNLVNRLANNGKSIYICAASTRGATIWQAAGIGPDQVQCAVERNPAKVGRMFSAIGIPIISEAEARRLKPDYLLIGPWFFADEILEREKEILSSGTKAIIPLPELRVI